MSDDSFMEYIINNSLYRETLEEPTDKEILLGRRKPENCEPHELMGFSSKSTNIVADHCHKTGIYRGWICTTCNTQLLPEIDRLARLGVSRDKIKTFFGLLVDYVFSTGAVIEDRLIWEKVPIREADGKLIRNPVYAVAPKVKNKCLSSTCIDPCNECPFR